MNERSKDFRWLLVAGLVVLIGYFVTHLWNLTALPVFADEAIYIRWAQLIIDDWKQYAFFPLNDGKTPLQMWLMVPSLFAFSDPLFAGRVISVLIGALQVVVIGWMTYVLGGRKKTVALAMVLTTGLPFWYFHHRMALTDALMTLFFSVVLAATIKSQYLFAKVGLKKPTIIWAALAGVAFGLALWTKIPALLVLPSLPLFIFINQPKNQQQATLSYYSTKLSLISLTVVVGLGIFGLLKLNPAFGQLFNRGNDFLFPWQEVFLQGKWTQTIRNLPSYVVYFGAYFTWPLLLMVIAGLFANKNQRIFMVLFLAAAAFVGPIALLGRVVYPRYLFPAMIALTVAAALSFQHFHDRYLGAKPTSLLAKTLISLVLTLFLAQVLGYSGLFIYHNIFDTNKIPFVASDREQYLTEWSSGHGITEVIAFLRDESKNQSLAVATEGSFGTLPDALLMYLHRTDVSNLYVEGIGYPVNSLSAKFLERAPSFDRQLLVVNSHRMQLPTEGLTLVMEVCRPFAAPCLQVWELTGSDLLSDAIANPPNRL